MQSRSPFYAASVALASTLLIAAARTTPADAKAFVEKAEAELQTLAIDAARADWIRSTFITEDTETNAARLNERAINATVRLAKEATAFDRLALDPVVARKLKLLKLSLDLATPSDPAGSAELTRIAAAMEGDYGKGKYCRGARNECLDLEEIGKILANSRDPKELQEVWTGWHAIAKPIKPEYQRFVTLSNKGARELGFSDTGAMWRAKYDLDPNAFASELDRLWEQVRPLYLSLHAYVRTRLREKYGESVVPANGPIPAHLLGNMWAQEWNNIYPLVAPPNADPGFDLTQILKAKNTGPLDMVRYGERFFTSLGFEPLPKTFWERSQFTKPRDREVVCHASAWDIDTQDDVRVKMCIDITSEYFSTVHHELGHDFYDRAYNRQPYLFRGGANDGFHEAVGDTIALSVTPEYLVKIGLLQSAPDPSKDIGLLMQRALEKIAFLPFGLIIDQWRWKVFSGEIKPEDYNKAWWSLKLKYQGVAPPVARTEEDFDPGAKYHVPANTPYARYFIADIVQFQFHRAMAQIAGCKQPLHRCSVYGNQEAGRRLKAMLEMGQSRPWPDAMKALTGQREMDASAILDYFAPLKKWLDEQNAGKPVGW